MQGDRIDARLDIRVAALRRRRTEGIDPIPPPHLSCCRRTVYTKEARLVWYSVDPLEGLHAIMA
jgi:hypothetical protein